SQAVEGLWQGWNSGETGRMTPESTGQAWSSFVAARDELGRHAQLWARQLAENDLALNLLDFCREIGRMRALKIEGSKHENSTGSSRG
ncbi:MAG: elongation factor P maturation arginine rhamnosyltransferase EarP, partial [Gallionella sp.]